MDKRRRDRQRRANFSAGGGHLEDSEVGRASKQALGRDRALARRRAARKSELGKAPAEPRAKQPVPPSPTVPAAEPGRAYARMNERAEPKRVKPVEQPSYLGDAARGVFRRVAKYALAPFALARAVVDRFRDRD